MLQRVSFLAHPFLTASTSPISPLPLSHHVHHGLWRSGNENISKEEAQEVLVRELMAAAKLPKNAKVLDVGCGVGGTSIMLAQANHRVTGVSLSPKQIEMAHANLQRLAPNASIRFLEMDGEKLDFPGEDGTFDAVWISEALSHFPHNEHFLAHALRLLKPGGKWGEMRGPREPERFIGEREFEREARIRARIRRV